MARKKQKKQQKNHKKDHKKARRPQLPPPAWRRLSPADADALPLPDFSLQTGSQRVVEAATAAEDAGRKRRARAIRSERWALVEPAIRIHVVQEDEEPALRYYSLAGVLITEKPNEELVTQGTNLDFVPGITPIGLYFAERILKISAVQGIVLRPEEIRIYRGITSAWAGDGIHDEVMSIITLGFPGMSPDDIEVHTTGFDPELDPEPYD